MPVKRKAHEAFGKTNRQARGESASAVPQVSAFAAARARQNGGPSTTAPADIPLEDIVKGNLQDISNADDPEYSTPLSGQAPQSLDALSTQHVSSATPVTSPARRTDLRLSSHAIRDVYDHSFGRLETDLEPGQFVSFIGEYNLEVLAGSINLCGASLRADSGRQRVYAYSTHAIPQIYCTSPKTRILVETVASLARKLERLSPLFRGISVPSDSNCSFISLEKTSQDVIQRSLTSLDLPKDHQLLLTKLAAQAEQNCGRIAIACVGGKSTGKSTLARHICNKLLTRSSARHCLYLDLDPGQPEFGPPGQIYLVEVATPLFGPPYTHFASRTSKHVRLLAAHTVAATTFRDDPDHYVDCVRALFDHEQVSAARANGACPIIVNTCGWTNGLGARILADILDMGVTDAVLIDTDPGVERMVAGRTLTIHNITRASTRHSTRTPASLRQMQTMAYFHTRPSRLRAPDIAADKIIDSSIASWRPWVVQYGNESSTTAIMSYGQPLNREFLAEIFDGAIVAIVSTDDQSVVSSAAGAPQPDEGLPYHPHRSLDPRSSAYHGLGLVRSIDESSKEIQLLTPLGSAEIAAFAQTSVVLVRGAFDNPDWAYLEDVYERGDDDHDIIRPWVAKREMVGIEGAVWRLRHPPTATKTITAR